jgi:hypothetical protein
MLAWLSRRSASDHAADGAGDVGAPALEPRSPTIYDVLGDRARRASDARLAIDASVGVVAILSLPFVRPLLWGLVLPFVIVGAYGLWGIADRELADDAAVPASPDAPVSSKRDVLVFIKRMAVVLGTAAAIVGAAMFMVMALGDFIS